MKTSCFYAQKYDQRFPISLLCLEIYGQLFTDGPPDQEEIFKRSTELIASHCGVESPSEDDFIYFVQKVMSLSESKGGKPRKSNPHRRSFGTEYEKFLNGLRPDQILLMMTGFCYPEARRLYCEVDCEPVYDMISSFIREKLEGNAVQMEAAMYGFGGKYKNDKKSANGPVHDMTTNEGVAALSSVKGFGML